MEQMTVNAIETQGLGKRYGSFWALQDCTITVPKGSITALVGPNGAGKSTLLKLLVGLNRPSSGSCTVLGDTSGASITPSIGYLAQEVPLYKQLSAEDHIQLGRRINIRWDSELAREHITKLDIPLDRSVKSLSGGQRAQVALALALAKKPKLLLLDEPVAALDPLAREDFLQSLTQAVADAEGELTVLMSSHLINDLERISDHLIVLATGKTQLCDSTSNVQQTHKLLIGARQPQPKNDAFTIVSAVHTPRQTTMLVRLKQPNFHDPQWQIQDVALEEITLAYMRGARQQAHKQLTKGDA